MFGGYRMEYTSLLVGIITSILFGAGAGIIGSVYRCLLADEPILNWWFMFGQRFEKKFFYRPVWGCPKCISGQLALWFYMGIVIMPRIIKHWGQILRFWTWDTQMIGQVAGSLFGLILAVSAGILAGEFLCKAINHK